MQVHQLKVLDDEAAQKLATDRAEAAAQKAPAADDAAASTSAAGTNGSAAASSFSSKLLQHTVLLQTCQRRKRRLFVCLLQVLSFQFMSCVQATQSGRLCKVIQTGCWRMHSAVTVEAGPEDGMSKRMPMCSLHGCSSRGAQY